MVDKIIIVSSFRWNNEANKNGIDEFHVVYIVFPSIKKKAIAETILNKKGPAFLRGLSYFSTVKAYCGMSPVMPST